MFVLPVIFIALILLYVIYGFMGRKLTIKEIDKKAVLITGCGSGFGRGLVERCLQNGLTVFAGCEFESNIQELEKSYSSISQNRLFAFQMNVTDDDSVRKARKYIDTTLLERNLVLHALVNNAGIHGTNFYDDFLNLENYKEVWDVNIFGVIRVTHAFKDLIKKSRGRIVICTSSITMFAVPSHGPYASSKFAAHAYISIIRHELQPYGVTVVEVCPGCFKTGLQIVQVEFKSFDTVWRRAPQEMRDEFGNNYNEEVKAFSTMLRPKLLAEDITWAIDAYFEAIVAKRPKLLYRVGWDSLCKYYPYSFLSIRLQLLAMKFLMYITGAPQPAIAIKDARSRNTDCKTD